MQNSECQELGMRQAAGAAVCCCHVTERRQAAGLSRCSRSSPAAGLQCTHVRLRRFGLQEWRRAETHPSTGGAGHAGARAKPLRPPHLQHARLQQRQRGCINCGALHPRTEPPARGKKLRWKTPWWPPPGAIAFNPEQTSVDLKVQKQPASTWNQDIPVEHCTADHEPSYASMLVAQVTRPVGMSCTQ